MYVCFLLNSTKMSRHLVTRVWSSRTHEVFCKDSVRSGGQESDLTVWRVTEQLSFRVLHGTRDGTVHESSHSELRNAQFAFQHRVLDQRKTGRPGAKTNPTVISTQNKQNGRTCFTIMICSLRWTVMLYLGMGEKILSPARNFLMVPPALNQLWRFSCWALRNSLLRCFHCWDVNVLRILQNTTRSHEV